MNRWDKIRETVGNSEKSEPDRLTPKKKVSRRTKIKQGTTDIPSSSSEDRDEYGQPVYKGTMVLPEMTSDAKRALTALVQQGTQDSGEIVIPNNLQGQKLPPKARVLPQTEPKSDHLLVKGIQIVKDMKTGDWHFGEIETNQGTFAMGPEQNARLNQKMLKNLAMYLKDTFEADLKDFLGLQDKDKE